MLIRAAHDLQRQVNLSAY